MDPELAALFEAAVSSFKQGNFQDSANHFSICLNMVTKGKDIDQLTLTDNISMIAFLHFKYGVTLLELARNTENFLGESIVSKEMSNQDNTYIKMNDSELNTDLVDSSSDSEANVDIDKSSESENDSLNPGQMDISSLDLSKYFVDKSEDALQIANNICDDLQLAWEALDTSRVLYQRLPLEKATKSLIEIYNALSEVCMESENWVGAQENLKLALELASSNTSIPGKERIVAEIYFKMALVSEYSSNFDEAIGHLFKSKEVLNSSLDKLISPIPSDSETSDLKHILLDIEAKVFSIILFLDRRAANCSKKCYLQQPNIPARNVYSYL